MTDNGRSEELENMMEQYGDEIKRFCTLQLKDPFQEWWMPRNLRMDRRP